MAGQTDSTVILEAINQVVQALNDQTISITVSGGSGGGGCGCPSQEQKEQEPMTESVGNDDNDADECYAIHALIMWWEDALQTIIDEIGTVIPNLGFTLLSGWLDGLMTGALAAGASPIPTPLGRVVAATAGSLYGMASALLTSRIDITVLKTAITNNRDDLILSISQYVNTVPAPSEAELRTFIALKLSSYGVGEQEEILFDWANWMFANEALGWISGINLPDNWTDIKNSLDGDPRYKPTTNCVSDPI